MNFIHTPYQNGVALREDLFHRQFEIRVTGMTEYPEDDPIYGTYYLEETLTVCEFSTISGAVEKLVLLYETDSWPIRDEGEDYYDSDLGHDCGPRSFSPRFAQVYDRQNRRVLCGDFSRGLVWFKPLTTPQDIATLQAKQCSLREEAAFESGWDNYSTARDLRAQATRLEMYLTDKRYACLPEVQNLATRRYTPESGHLWRDPGIVYCSSIRRVSKQLMSA
ncbi:hypothetical protein [Erwinia oleae]|uniref:hypothetical protein n=1 Tax=Erwinia oleae TaxID=796334 RepID=UPI00068EBFBF|nr:hypothetical protein [Erwinia oleae]